MEEWLLADDFVGMKVDIADSALALSHKSYLNHIDVKVNEGVEISTIRSVRNDILKHARVEVEHQTMWLERKIDDE